MKTIAMKTKMSASRFFLLTFCLLMMSSLKVASATKYGFWVGGVEVTSDNYLNITGSNITSGTVEYNPNINTLTLTNCTITRTGDNNHAIENNSCENLRIEFVGINNLSARDASAVRFETSGGLSVISGTTTLLSENQEGIYLYSKDKTERRLSIGGPGTINIKSTNDCGIEGNLRDGKRYFKVEFAKAKAIISGKKGDLVDILEARAFNNSEVTLKATNNSNYPNVKNTELLFTQSELMEWMHDHNSTIDRMAGFSLILKPWGTYKSADGKLLYNNSEIYNQDIVFSNCWSFLLNSDFFPDTNFLSFLKTTKFPNKNYVTKSEEANCTSLNLNGRSIASLKGIELFPSLEQLYCGSNNLTELDLSKNTALTLLSCSNNKLKKLDLSNNTALTSLYCSNNKLTGLIGLGPDITTINCSGNDFESLYITHQEKLKNLNCSNNSSLMRLDCNQNNLETLDFTNCINLVNLNCAKNKLTTLSVANCPNLSWIYCGYNKFEELVITDAPSLSELYLDYNTELSYLDCSRNILTDLQTVGCSNLSQIICSSNSFSSLTITGLKSLRALNCSNNVYLTTLDCHDNALEGEQLLLYDCRELRKLDCSINGLTSLDLSDCKKLISLNCESNMIRGTLDLQSHNNLTNLNCSQNDILTLNLSSSLSNFQTLTCYSNKISNMGDVVSKLPDRSHQSEIGILNAIYLPYDNNVITKSQVNEAWSKYWKTYQLVNGSWMSYEGSDGGIATGLEPAVSSAAEDATPLYNLSGQRVDKSYKGVVIRNNKKVRMK